MKDITNEEIGKGIDKVKGDIIYLFEDKIHTVEYEPNIFISNRYATKEEIEKSQK